MRYIFYRYQDSWLILRYSDDNGKRFSMRYFDYSFQEAISKFRREYHLRYKHIKIKKL